ncbi:Similar to PHC3: Polyhomeotic-like protein 3 (Homo sapiens) [Cotesia congregata]|uniref:Similar to PHC3: Polyhomeotic-like protein 3 (Homo sapiens) n=1 Tax=Cotesia congregata TaxID=51543 RepID=A0A8J2EMQ8_COTCN|nr:Similar to PHC3: Polyhomeotic-like protein 3 (Homo sapiens) [Cotesia congregata]
MREINELKRCVAFLEKTTKILNNKYDNLRKKYDELMDDIHEQKQKVEFLIQIIIDESKQSAKEETAAKTDDKLSNNPLVNLDNAVNSITNGITNEPANAVSTPTSSGKQALPKALVKLQVLTHVIEGFVIQESSEPFADKQWTDMDVDSKKDDPAKKIAEEKSVLPIEDLTPKINPIKWTVNEVCDFIRNLPGCSDYAEDFAIQEIDGQALMLLKEDHLMSGMSIKLGPALKIVAKVDSMRIDNNVSNSPLSNSS